MNRILKSLACAPLAFGLTADTVAALQSTDLHFGKALEPAVSDTQRLVSTQSINECRMNQDRIARLACFDTLFDTPKDLGGEEDLSGEAVSVPNASIDSLYASIAHSSDAILDPSLAHWSFAYQNWDEEAYQTYETFRILIGLTDPEPGTVVATQIDLLKKKTFNVFFNTAEILPADAPARQRQAKVFFACENNISFIALITPDMPKGQAGRLSLSNLSSNSFDQGEPEASVSVGNWLNLEGNVFLLAPRGVETIRVVKQLAKSPRMHLSMQFDNGQRDYVFNTSGLENVMTAMRLACHW